MLALVLVPGAAGASSHLDAPALAADCNADGAVVLTADQVYRGGTGTLTGLCVVTLAPGVTMVLKGLTLNGTGGFVVGNAQENTRVVVAASTIDLAGPIQISPGCCAGEGEPGRSEAYGFAKVVRSLLRGTTVEVSASIASGYGRVVAYRARLVATDPAGTVRVVASASGGPAGKVSVSESKLAGAGEQRVDTGAQGTTRVVDTRFVRPTSVITTGPGGVCVSRRNTPAVPCT